MISANMREALSAVEGSHLHADMLTAGATASAAGALDIYTRSHPEKAPVLHARGPANDKFSLQ